MSDTFENSNTVPCPACNAETSKNNTFCSECGERLIPLAADGSMPVAAEAVANPYDAPAAPAAPTAGEAEVTTPPWHEPSQNPYANVSTGAMAAAANPYGSTPNTSAGSPYDDRAAHGYTAPPSYQRANQPMSANTIGARVPGESKVLASVSLVCGITSLVCCCLTFLTAIVGLVTGIIVLTKKKGGRGFAIAGVVLSAVSLVLYAIIFIAYFIVIQETGRDFMDIYQGLGL
jgi:hypothetical protein